MKNYDIIILGTGQAAGTLLGRFIPEGKSIAVIEGGKAGGSCVNYGCTPTKTLVASARAIHMARQGGTYGFQTGNVEVNFARVMERMNETRESSRQGLESWMENSKNVTLIRELGRFTGPNTIQAGGQEIKGEKIFINVGTRATVPPVPGLAKVPWMDNAAILELDEVPEHLLIIGGGYIGIEFAQVFRRFGAEVTIVQKNAQIMPREDADIAAAIREFLEEEGIRILTGTTPRNIVEENGSIIIELASNDGNQQVRGSHLLVATGRTPNSKQLDLANANLKTDDRGFIQVNDHCQTAAEGIYALGDVNGNGAFTHTSVNDAEIAVDHLYHGPRKLSSRNTIYALFSDPPLGRVGLTEKAALEQGMQVRKAIQPMKNISRAKEMSETTGFVKILVDASSDQFIGAAILGTGGDEVINMFAAMMHAKVPWQKFRETVLIHPTVSEMMPWTLDGLEEISG